MIGTRLEAHGGLPIFESIFMAAAVTLLALGALTSTVHWYMLAVLPAAIAIALWLARHHEFAAEVTAEGLQLAANGQVIRYSAMRSLDPPASSVQPPVRAASYSFVVLHDGGSVRVPARLNVSSHELAAFLTARIPPRPTLISPQLEEYLQRQTASYGPENVWAFAAREMPKRSAPRMATAVAVAGLAASMLWCILGVIMASVAGQFGRQDAGLVWSGIGIFSFFLWLLVLMFVRTWQPDARQGIKNPDASSLVISPQGLAVVQGNVAGELQWREVRGLKRRARERIRISSADARSGPGLHLDVGGATIWIADIYDQPLDAIEKRIRQYWLGLG